MNKQQKNDLIFIIFSCIPIVFIIVSILLSFAVPNLFRTKVQNIVSNTFFNALYIMLVYTPIFAMFDIVSSLEYKSKHKPIQYEKQKIYNRCILFLGFVNIISFFVLGLLLIGISLASMY